MRIDHSAWGDFLKKYVVTDTPSGVNLVRYGEVLASDRTRLDRYLTRLQGIKISEYSRPEQKAYWINLYNALTVQVVLQNYPVKSIRDIKSGWFSAGPWGLKVAKVAGVELSLNDIEHRILRPIWGDNRIHYAVNCASLGCPDLQAEPFTAENIELLLNAASYRYVNHSRGVRFEKQTLVLSKIFDWYQVDFGESEESMILSLEKFASPELKEKLVRFMGEVIYEYDWALNDS
jgi:hypothetical protein